LIADYWIDAAEAVSTFLSVSLKKTEINWPAPVYALKAPLFGIRPDT